MRSSAQCRGRASMKADKGAALGILAILVLGMTALTWFRGDYTAVAGYDFATSLKPLDDLTRATYLWDERLYTGAPNVLSIGTWPYFLLQYAFESVAGSVYRGQMLFFALIFTLPGLTMFWFLRTAFEGDEEVSALSFFGAIFYMFNTYVVVKWNRGELVTLFSYGMLPLYLGLVERGLKRPIGAAFIVAFVAAMFFYPVTLGHSADFLITTSIISSYAAWRLYDLGRGAVKRAALLFLAASFLSLWWVLPVLGGMSAPPSTEGFTGAGLEILHYYSWASLFSLMKMWFFPMYATATSFDVQFYRPGTVIFPMLAFLALLVGRNRLVLFFSLMAVAGLWLSKGVFTPLPGIYEWMYLNVPYFFIFRAPTRYFPLIYTLCLAVLIGFSLSRIMKALKDIFPGRKIALSLFALAALSVFFFHSWPVFSRDNIFRTAEKDVLYPSIFIKVPEYYGALERWLDGKDGYFRVHSFNNQPYLNYTWGYSSTDILPKLIERPQTLLFRQELVFGNNGFHQLMGSFDRSFWSWDFDRVDRFLGLFGVRYITVIDDVLRRYQPDTNSIEFLKSFLDGAPGLEKQLSAGKAAVYKNNYSADHVFAARKLKGVYGGAEGLLTLTNTDYMETDPAFMLASGPADLNDVPEGSLDEAIFSEANLWDMAADNIDPEYRIKDFKDPWFQADVPGRYFLLAKTALRGADYKGNAYVDGVKSLSKPDSYIGGEGIRWKVLGAWRLSSGIHRVRFDTVAFRSAVVVPMRVWEEDFKRVAAEMGRLKATVSHVMKSYGEGRMHLYARTGKEAAEFTMLPPVKRKRVWGLTEKFAQRTAGKCYRADHVSLKHPFDPEEYPYMDMDFHMEPEGHYDLTAFLGVDTNGDGKADEEVEAARFRADGSKTIFNLSTKLKERFGFPGLAKYAGVKVSLNAKRSKRSDDTEGLKTLYVKRIGFYHEVPVLTQTAQKQKHGLYMKRPIKQGPAVVPITGPGIVKISERMESAKKSVLPVLGYRKINSARYAVDVKNPSKEPFWLVFNEAYNDGWKAYADEGALKSHQVINGYANGWWVDNRKDEFTIAIEFAPQRLLTWGTALSAATAACLFAAGGVLLIKSGKGQGE